MGKAFKELNLPRTEIVVTTKLFAASPDDLKVNERMMSRKHIIEGV